MDLNRLKEPFPADSIEWRVQSSGWSVSGKPWCKVLAYLTSRAVMDRLDEVCGPTGWEDHYVAGPQGGVVCRLTIHHPDRSVTREDGAENTDVEAVKGGISDALKRAAVKFGVGRYLYNLGDSFAECRTDKPPASERDRWHYVKPKQGEAFWWTPPQLPPWALPGGESASAKPTDTSARKRAAAKAAGGKVKPAGDGNGDPDHRGLVKELLHKVCRCETPGQADAVINYVTDGVYTDVSELDDPSDAEKVHAAFREYAKKHRLEGLALSNEIGAALGL